MSDRAGFPWPTPPGHERPPVWTGHGFDLGGDVAPVLAFPTGDSGWTDDLTSFHEDTAGTDHPIDRASRALALDALRRFAPPRPIVLDVGCSSGFMLRVVREALPGATAIGADYVRGPLDQLAVELPGVPLLQFDLVQCPLPAGCVDAVILLNVLEHIADDGAAMAQVGRILRPGGIAVIEVPAGPQLFDVYDELLMHHRRYTLGRLEAITTAAGLRVRRRTHLGVFVYPAFAAVKRRNKRYLTRERAVQQQVVGESIRRTRSSGPLELLFRLEGGLGRWVSWPFGIRCALVAQKGGA